jgi:hypothetical protein
MALGTAAGGPPPVTLHFRSVAPQLVARRLPDVVKLKPPLDPADSGDHQTKAGIIAAAEIPVRHRSDPLRVVARVRTTRGQHRVILTIKPFGRRGSAVRVDQLTRDDTPVPPTHAVRFPAKWLEEVTEALRNSPQPQYYDLASRYPALEV